MRDVERKQLGYWEVDEVFQKIPSFCGEFLINLSQHKGVMDTDTVSIRISNYNMFEKLQELKEKGGRTYLAYGMQDIDVYKEGKDYIIMHSPIDGIYHFYKLKASEFDKLLNCGKEIHKEVS